MPDLPWRAPSVTAHCAWCQGPLPTGRVRLFCSGRCRRAPIEPATARRLRPHRRRRPAAPAPPAASTNAPAAATGWPANAAARSAICSPAASAREDAAPPAVRSSPSRSCSTSSSEPTGKPSDRTPTIANEKEPPSGRICTARGTRPLAVPEPSQVPRMPLRAWHLLVDDGDSTAEDRQPGQRQAFRGQLGAGLLDDDAVSIRLIEALVEVGEFGDLRGGRHRGWWGVPPRAGLGEAYGAGWPGRR